MENHNTKNGKPLDEFFTFVYTELGYRTEKKKLETEDDLNKIVKDNKHLTTTFNSKTIDLPLQGYLAEVERGLESVEHSKKGGIFEIRPAMVPEK